MIYTRIQGGSGVLRELCLARKQYGLLLGTEDQDFDQLKMAAPYLSEDDVIALAFGEIYLFFDTMAECFNAFERTVGDDGPTELNPYDGPVNVYALVCGPDGEFWDNNI